MELSYCDGCGSIVQLAAGETRSRSGQTLCPKCRGANAAAGGASSERESLPVTGIDESPLAFLNDPGGGGGSSKDPGDDPLDLYSPHQSQLPRMGSSRPPSHGPDDQDVRAEPSLDKGLTLFSSDTIVAKQLAFGPADESADHDPDPPSEPGGADEFDESLTLFSSKTIVAKKKKHFGVSTRSAAASGEDLEIKIAVEDGLNEDVATPVAIEPNPVGSEVPAPTATRLKFHCGSCNSALVVRPVKKRSKMVCPRCSVRMYIDPDGQVTGPEPRQAPGKDGGTIVPNLRRSSARGARGEAGSLSEAVERTVEEKAAELSRLGGGPDVSYDDDFDEDASEPAADAGDAIPPVEGGVPPPDVNSIMRQLEHGAEVPAPGDRTEESAETSAPRARTASHRHAGGAVAEVERLERSDSSWGALLQAGFFGVLLAAPLCLLGALVDSGDTPADETSAVRRALEQTGERVEVGLRRLVDAIGDL